MKRVMGKNKNYVVGIYDDTRMSHNLSQAQKNKEITEFFTRFKYFGPMIVKENINDVLDEALNYDVDYCLIQSVGHIIKEAAFFTFIENLTSRILFWVQGWLADSRISGF